jgi:hypothetical protein
VQTLHALREAADISGERAALKRLAGAYTKLSCQQLVRSSDQKQLKSMAQTLKKELDDLEEDSSNDSDLETDDENNVSLPTLRCLYKAVVDFLEETKTESESESEPEPGPQPGPESKLEAGNDMEQMSEAEVAVTEAEGMVTEAEGMVTEAEGMVTEAEVMVTEAEASATSTTTATASTTATTEDSELADNFNFEAVLLEMESQLKELMSPEDFARIHYALQSQVGSDSRVHVDSVNVDEEKDSIAIDAEMITSASATVANGPVPLEIAVAEPFASKDPSASRIVCDAVTSGASPFVVATLLAAPFGIAQECVAMVLDEKESPLHLRSDPMIHYLASLRATQLSQMATLQDWTEALPAAIPSSLRNLSKIGNLAGTQMSSTTTRQSAAIAALAPVTNLQDILASSISDFNAYFAALQPGLEASIPASSAIASFGTVLKESSVTGWLFAKETNDASALISALLDGYSVSHSAIDIYADEVDGIQRALDSKYFYLVQPSHKVVIGRVVPGKTRAFALQETIALRFMMALYPWVLQLRSVILSNGTVLVLDASRSIYTLVADGESTAIPRVFAEQLIQEHALTLIYEPI